MVALSSPGIHVHRGFGWRDVAALLLVVGVILLLGEGLKQMTGPFLPARQVLISLSPAMLPLYTLRTVMRMLAAMAASLIFTFTYATLAAKSRRAEMALIPLLDVLQSVPILGYLSFTVVFFVSLAPGSVLGPELAAIFAIFTSQAWNMAFSFYQSLIMVPHDLVEASDSVRSSPWQRFWRLEVPFAMPGLVWNMMMSMSGGWFFVVAAEAISVGRLQIALPGIGSYVARAIEERDLTAVFWAIAAMSVAIILYDQLLFRPLVTWAEKFRVEQSAAQVVSRSWLLDLIRRSPALEGLARPSGRALTSLTHARLAVPWRLPRTGLPRRWGDRLWIGFLILCGVYVGWRLAGFARATLGMEDLQIAALSGALTFFRVAVLVLLASLIWVPLGVAIGLRPRLTQTVQPLIQFLAAFPANLLFPLAVFLIVRFHLGPRLWLSPLMILGTQWYILFNVVAGASSFPTDLREAAATFRIRCWHWWRNVVLPGIFPYFVTGAITASGGAWNASIVSEAVSWGTTRLDGGGLGAYIAEMTERGDYPRIALGVAVMSLLVVVTNRLIWRPLYVFAQRRTRLD